jgi:hypothetical protein
MLVGALELVYIFNQAGDMHIRKRVLRTTFQFLGLNRYNGMNSEGALLVMKLVFVDHLHLHTSTFTTLHHSKYETIVLQFNQSKKSVFCVAMDDA